MTENNSLSFYDPLPEELQVVFDTLLKKKTMIDVDRYVRQILPGWIIGYAKAYGLDYPHLTTNWKYFTDEIGCVPTQILIVAETFLPEDKNHKLAVKLQELYVKAGFMVHSQKDVVVCKECPLIIPSRRNYDMMVKMGKIDDLPEEWTDTCSCHHRIVELC